MARPPQPRSSMPPAVRSRRRNARRKNRAIRTALAAEVSYVKVLRRMWVQAQQIIAYGLRPLLRAWARTQTDQDQEELGALVEELGDWFDKMAAGGGDILDDFDLPDLPTPDDVDEDVIERQVEWLRVALGRWFDEETTKEYWSRTSDQIDLFAMREIGEVLAIDLRREIPGLQVLINIWRDENISLINGGLSSPLDPSLTRQSLLADLSSLVEESHAQGLRVERLADEIQSRFGVSMSRAELIARDQVLKLNGRINQHRQQAVGITHYIWVTSRDARVRPEHRRLDGTRQSWDSPPPVGGGRRAHPGEDFQCRCTAKPVPPDWLV